MADTTTHEPLRGDAGPKQIGSAGAKLKGGDKERYVKEMFSAIAPQYDRLNAILSLQQHKLWRRRAVRLARVAPGDCCLDVCTGTGDFAVDLASAVGDAGRVIGADFCEPMIRSGLLKMSAARGGPIRAMVANAERLPYESAIFDVVTVGFGIRNVADVRAAVGEMARVTRPGGRVVILEFNRPRRRWYRPFVDFYLFHVLPRIGGLLSRREAYTYLPESMKRFISREELSAVMEAAGLSGVRVYDLNFGTVCIHIGARGAADGVPSMVGAPLQAGEKPGVAAPQSVRPAATLAPPANRSVRADHR